MTSETAAAAAAAAPGNGNNSNNNNQRDDEDAEILEMLKQAGFDENAPIDPSSREALRELLSGDNYASNQNKPLGMESDGDDAENEIHLFKSPPAPVPQISTSNKVLQRHVSELSDNNFVGGLSPSPAAGGGGGLFGFARGEAASNASTAGDETISKEDLILRKLEQQTALIVDLHKRIDDLTLMVQQNSNQQLQHNGAPTSVATTTTTNTRAAAAAPPLRPAQVAAAEPPVAVAAPRRPLRGAALHHGRHEPEPREQERGEPLQIHNVYQRLHLLVRLFFALRRRQVPNLDGGLIFKVVIMLAILLSRLSHRRHRSRSHDSSAAEDWAWDYRNYILIFLVIGGFLVQTGFVKFVWQFLVQENYIARILIKGEEIDVTAEGLRLTQQQQQRERQQRRRRQDRNQAAAAGGAPRPRGAGGDANNNNNNDAPAAGWRDTFLGGGIARNNNNNENNNGEPGGGGGGAVAGPLAIVQDVGYIIGSFFLSIFPMWRPQGIGAPPAAADNADQPQQQPNNNDDDNDNGLPQVRAPRNAMEAADDDDHDDNEPRRRED